MAAGLTWLLWYMFLCVKAFVLTLSKGATSVNIPKIKMHNMSFLRPPLSWIRIYDTLKVLCCVGLSFIFYKLTTAEHQHWQLQVQQPVNCPNVSSLRQRTYSSPSWWDCAATLPWPSSKTFVRYQTLKLVKYWEKTRLIGARGVSKATIQRRKDTPSGHRVRRCESKHH